MKENIAYRCRCGQHQIEVVELEWSDEKKEVGLEFWHTFGHPNERKHWRSFLERIKDAITCLRGGRLIDEEFYFSCQDAAGLGRAILAASREEK